MCLGLVLDWFYFVKGFDVILDIKSFLIFFERKINEKTPVIPSFINETEGHIKRV